MIRLLYPKLSQRIVLALVLGIAHVAAGQAPALTRKRPTSRRDAFPPELVKWSPAADNPIFTAEGPGHWDVKIRERGWILREADTYRMWFTGYDGTREG